MIIFGHALSRDDLTDDDYDFIDNHPELQNFIHFGYSSSCYDPEIMVIGAVVDDSDDLFNPIYIEDFNMYIIRAKGQIEYLQNIHQFPESIIEKFDRDYPALISIVMSDD